MKKDDIVKRRKPPIDVPDGTTVYRLDIRGSSSGMPLHLSYFVDGSSAQDYINWAIRRGNDLAAIGFDWLRTEGNSPEHFRSWDPTNKGSVSIDAVLFNKEFLNIGVYQSFNDIDPTYPNVWREGLGMLGVMAIVDDLVKQPGVKQKGGVIMVPLADKSPSTTGRKK